MHTRNDLQADLESFLGSRNVYFQPPSNVRMKYPCILYDWARVKPTYANNHMYLHTNGYDVTIIDQHKDSDIPERFMEHFMFVDFRRVYESDGLWHFVFNLYY